MLLGGTPTLTRGVINLKPREQAGAVGQGVQLMEDKDTGGEGRGLPQLPVAAMIISLPYVVQIELLQRVS